MEIIEHFSEIPLFKGLPRVHLENLTSIAIKKTFYKGEVIFLEGSESTGFYIVILGKVKIYKLSSEGKEQILHFFGPGEPFGEVPAFTGDRFPAYAEAIEEMTSKTFFNCPSTFSAIFMKIRIKYSFIVTWAWKLILQ